MKEIYLSVDLGGTNLRLAALDDKGRILRHTTLESEQVRDPVSLVKCLAEELLKLQNDSTGGQAKVLGAGLGIPGLVDIREGNILQSPHFPQWDHFALKAELAPRLPFPIFVENDANKAALGEAWFGAGKGLSDFIMLTLGTGVGAGIIVHRQIFHGTHGFAGEVGHMVIDMAGLHGALKIRGTLETFASASGLRLHLQEWQKNKIPKSDPLQRLSPDDPHLPEALVQWAKAGNPIATQLWDQFGRALACGIASLANILGIFDFILGGGLLGAWELFYPPFQEELPKRIYRATLDRVKIHQAQLGQDAGLIGGIPLVQQGLKAS
jgi:glucokinase